MSEIPIQVGDLVVFNERYNPQPGSPGHARIGHVFLIVRGKKPGSKLNIVQLLHTEGVFPAFMEDLRGLPYEGG